MQQFKINNQIKVAELRVLGEDNENIGVLALSDALKLANEKGLDLILIVETATPPVARIMSFDKFRYIKEKEAKKQKQAAKAPEMKQIQISVREAKNDLMMKIGRMDKFLKDGHRVEVVLRLRGREKAMKDWAEKKIKEFIGLIPFEYKISQPVKFEGNQFIVRFDPK